MSMRERAWKMSTLAWRQEVDERARRFDVDGLLRMAQDATLATVGRVEARMALTCMYARMDNNDKRKVRDVVRWS